MEKPSLTMLPCCLMFLLFIWAAHGDGQDDCDSEPEYMCTFPGDNFCGWNHPNIQEPSSGGDENEDETKVAIPGIFKSPKFCGPRTQKKTCVVVKITNAFDQSSFRLSVHTDGYSHVVGFPLKSGTLFVQSFRSRFQLWLQHEDKIQTSDKVYARVWVTLTPAESQCSTNPETAEETEAATFPTAVVASVVIVLVVVLVITVVLFVLIRSRRRRRQQPLCKMCLKNDSSHESSKTTGNAAPGLPLRDPKQLRDEQKTANHVTPQSNRPSQTLEHEYSVITFGETTENMNVVIGNTTNQSTNRAPSDKSSQSAYSAHENSRLSQTPEHVYTVITEPGNSQSTNPGVENNVGVNRNEKSSAQSATGDYNTLNFHDAGQETVSMSETKGDYNHLPSPAETGKGTGNGKPETTSFYHCLEEDEESCPKEASDANKPHHAREHNDAENSQLADISSAYDTLEEGRNVATADLASGYSLQKQTGDDALYCLGQQQQPQQQKQEEDHGSTYYILEDESAAFTKDPTPFTYELAKTDGLQASTDFQEEKANEASSTRGTTETLTDYNSLDFEGKSEDGKKTEVARTTDVYNHLNEEKKPDI